MAKRNIREVLGFNDIWLLLAGIPFLAFITPYVYLGLRFTRPPYYPLIGFVSSLVITIILWMGNRFILIRMRKKYPMFEQSRKRIIITALLMLLFTMIVANFNGVTPPLWSAIEYNYPDLNVLGIGNTLIIVSIYEVIWYTGRLRISMQEKEDLKNESLLAQIKALKSQVDPHFLFNNLNTLTAIVHDDPAKAEVFIQQLSKLYRYILEMPENTLIPVKEELGLLDAYVYLLKTRFESNLKVSINIPESYHEHKMIPFALQILVENAIKHNVVSTAKPLTVSIEVEGDKIIVTNNLQKKKAVVSTGKGLENINSRIRLLSQEELQCITTMDQYIVTLPIYPAV